MDIILRIQDNNSARQFVKQVPLPCVIGRGKDTNLTIAHPLVSRKHCALLVSAGKLVLRDLDSLNGTYIGMKRITKDFPLSLGQIFSVGAINFQCEKVVQPKVVPTAQGSGDKAVSQAIPMAPMVPKNIADVSTTPASLNEMNVNQNIPPGNEFQNRDVIQIKNEGAAVSMDGSTLSAISTEDPPVLSNHSDPFALDPEKEELALSPLEEELSFTDDEDEDELVLIDDSNGNLDLGSELSFSDNFDPVNSLNLNPTGSDEQQRDPFFGMPKNPYDS